MALISITRLRLRSWRYLLPFLYYSYRSSRQAQRSPGFLGGRTVADRNLAFWTVTNWADESSMRAYRSSGAHANVMPKLLDWCDEGAVGHWEEPAPRLPDFDEVYRRMTEIGRPSRLNHPSPNHQSLGIAPPRFRAVQNWPPVSP